jgi:hypothetical protein
MAKLRYFPNSSFRASPFVNKKTILRYYFAFFGSVNIEAVRSIFESETTKLKQFVHFAKKKFSLLIRYVLDLGEFWFWSTILFRFAKKSFPSFLIHFVSILRNSGQTILFRFTKNNLFLFCFVSVLNLGEFWSKPIRFVSIPQFSPLLNVHFASFRSLLFPLLFLLSLSSLLSLFSPLSSLLSLVSSPPLSSLSLFSPLLSSLLSLSLFSLLSSLFSPLS